MTRGTVRGRKRLPRRMIGACCHAINVRNRSAKRQGAAKRGPEGNTTGGYHEFPWPRHILEQRVLPCDMYRPLKLRPFGVDSDE